MTVVENDISNGSQTIWRYTAAPLRGILNIKVGKFQSQNDIRKHRLKRVRNV